MQPQWRTSGDLNADEILSWRRQSGRTNDIESFFVAITEISTVAGYLAGCLDNPAHNPRFADIGYYASFAPLCDCYPCHLHINLDERYRNRGIGSALIDAFAAQAASAGRSGIHVVTGERARNVRFYEKNEFRSLATVIFALLQ